jgi:hypothetical protein
MKPADYIEIVIRVYPNSKDRKAEAECELWAKAVVGSLVYERDRRRPQVVSVKRVRA